jgi:hypothetical protein
MNIFLFEIDIHQNMLSVVNILCPFSAGEKTKSKTVIKLWFNKLDIITCKDQRKKIYKSLIIYFYISKYGIPTYKYKIM